MTSKVDQGIETTREERVKTDLGDNELKANKQTTILLRHSNRKEKKWMGCLCLTNKLLTWSIGIVGSALRQPASIFLIHSAAGMGM